MMHFGNIDAGGRGNAQGNCPEKSAEIGLRKAATVNKRRRCKSASSAGLPQWQKFFQVSPESAAAVRVATNGRLFFLRQLGDELVIALLDFLAGRRFSGDDIDTVADMQRLVFGDFRRKKRTKAAVGSFGKPRRFGHAGVFKILKRVATAVQLVGHGKPAEIDVFIRLGFVVGLKGFGLFGETGGTHITGAVIFGDRLCGANLKSGMLPVAGERDVAPFAGEVESKSIWNPLPASLPSSGRKVKSRASTITGLPRGRSNGFPQSCGLVCHRPGVFQTGYAVDARLFAMPKVEFLPLELRLVETEEDAAMVRVFSVRAFGNDVVAARPEDMVEDLKGLVGTFLGRGIKGIHVADDRLVAVLEIGRAGLRVVLPGERRRRLVFGGGERGREREEHGGDEKSRSFFEAMHEDLTYLCYLSTDVSSPRKMRLHSPVGCHCWLVQQGPAPVARFALADKPPVAPRVM